MTPPLTISVILPVLNEQANIEAPDRIWSRRQDGVEFILSDGGSSDGTVAAGRALGIRIVEGSRGRGQQIARAAAVATGDVLLMLHADTRLEPGAFDAVRGALADPGVVGGNFRLLFDGDDDFSRWLNDFYARIRRHGFYYGDSVIFARRDAYAALGGIRPMALMEDFDFVRRMERHGETVCIAAPPATTSSRRFHGRPAWRIVGQWLLIHALYYIRTPPEALAWLYRWRRHAPGERSGA